MDLLPLFHFFPVPEVGQRNSQLCGQPTTPFFLNLTIGIDDHHFSSGRPSRVEIYCGHNSVKSTLGSREDEKWKKKQKLSAPPLDRHPQPASQHRTHSLICYLKKTAGLKAVAEQQLTKWHSG
jgi:hypothetical protein